jgi:hypothetical protein
VRRVERATRNTRDIASLSAPLLTAEDVCTAILVGHAGHTRLARPEAKRADAWPESVRAGRIPDRRPDDRMPRPDHLAVSWFVLREWAALLARRIGV